MSLISGNATFGGNAINCSSNSILGAAAFINTASNQGTVSVASFSNTAVNEGTAVSAVFNDGAVNVGSLTSGTFLGTAVNSGVVNVAEFFGTASNVGVIVEAAKFADTSSNVGTVSGSAIFADTSISDGVVIGAVQLGVNVTEGENQALTETPTEYTQADGFFPNAHYSSGVKAAPADYATVVHQVGGFWYKYDVNGNGSLANGVFSDGVSVANGGDSVMFIFVNGIKGSQKSIAKTINSTNYFYTGTIGNGTTLYTNAALTSLAASLALNVEDLDNDGISDFYVTNGQGQVTIEYGKQTSVGGYYYYGTIQNGTVLYTDEFITPASLGVSTAVGDNNNDGILEFVITNMQGVITEVRGPEVVQLDGTDYYYRGSIIGGNYEPALAAGYTLYTDQMLTILAISKGDYLDIDNDGIYDHVTTDGSGTVSITNGQSTPLGGTTYYHLGAFGDGAVLYSDASLETLATGLSNVNVGDISDPVDGFNDFVSTDNVGVVTITYGEAPAVNEIKLPYADANDGDSVSYYYAAEDVFEAGIVLYTDDTLTTTANLLDLVNEITDKKYTTSNVGVLTIQDISTTSINNTTYYYTGTLTSGVTVLYVDNLLTSTVNNLFYYYNNADENTDKLYTTNNVGVLTMQDGLQVTINSITYRYVGTLTSGLTILRDNATFDPVSAFSYADTDDDILYGADSNGVYYEQTILTTTINSITYYYTETLTSGSTVLYSDNGLNTIATATSYVDENADIYYEIDANGVYSSETINTINDASNVTYYHIGTFGVGTTLYTSNDFMSAAVNLLCCNFGDLSSPPDGFNDLIWTDSSGSVCQIQYGTE